MICNCTCGCEIEEGIVSEILFCQVSVRCNRKMLEAPSYSFSTFHQATGTLIYFSDTGQ